MGSERRGEEGKEIKKGGGEEAVRGVKVRAERAERERVKKKKKKKTEKAHKEEVKKKTHKRRRGEGGVVLFSGGRDFAERAVEVGRHRLTQKRGKAQQEQQRQ